jgi:hypothetical protein
VHVMRSPGGEEDADGELGVGVNVEVLRCDVLCHGEGKIDGRDGLVGATGDSNAVVATPGLVLVIDWRWVWRGGVEGCRSVVWAP